jgi:hypothetical protein
MTLDEKLDIVMQEIELRKQGKVEEGMKLFREKVPMAPCLAKAAKEFCGADFLIQNGYNLTEAEAEFGPDWLTAK